MIGGRQLIVTLIATALTAAAILASVAVVARTPDQIDPTGPRAAVAGSGETVAFTVEPDQSAARIGAELQRQGLIRSGRQFALLVRLTAVDSKLTAGVHEIERGSSTLAVIRTLTSSEIVPTLKVTFPEGLRFEEMAPLAEKAGFGPAASFLEAVAKAKLPAELADSLPPEASLQGYLFPDTYILPVGATMDDLVALMLKTFALRFTPELRNAVIERGLTIHGALTLASIIEREAAVASERPIMAAVFYNRLAAGDLIGADPTVQFAVTVIDPTSISRFGYWKKELTKEDLAIESEYNTRKFAGIPPGPIASPGLASMEAVAKPATTKAYYFVANARANDGSHVFAETLAEHERNQALYGAP